MNQPPIFTDQERSLIEKFRDGQGIPGTAQNVELINKWRRYHPMEQHYHHPKGFLNWLFSGF